MFSRINLMGRFLWDPESVLARPEGTQPPAFLKSPILFILLLAILGTGYHFKLAHLTCWTPAFYSSLKMAVLLGCIGVASLLLPVFKGNKKLVFLAIFSHAVTLYASLPLWLLSSATLTAYFLVVKLLKGYWRHTGVLAIIATMMVFFNFRLFPGIVFSDFWSLAGLMWAFFIPLRLVWFHYQVTRSPQNPPDFLELNLYFFMIPAPIMLPYMFAIPRREEITAAGAPDDGTLARGSVYIMAGIAFYLAYQSFDRLFMVISTIPHMKWVLIPWSYPFEPVFYALGSAYVITGLYNRLGASVTLAFRSPLNSNSVLEWWRRWNVHFRDMLVEIFFYPFVMGKRQNPYLRLWAGTFGVFIIGSTILHWAIKHYFGINDTVFYWSMLVENSIMFIAVGILLHYERWQTDRAIARRRQARLDGITLPPPLPIPLWRRFIAYPVTYFIVFVSVMGGYSSNLIINGTYVDQGTAVMYHAQKLGGKKRAYYLQKADNYFTKILKNIDDVSSPWKIKERHAAMKLILLRLNEEKHHGIDKLLKILKWDSSLSKKPDDLRRKIDYELNVMKGISGIKRMLRGKLEG